MSTEDYSKLTLQELISAKAKLYDIFYETKGKIKQVEYAEKAKNAELDGIRRLMNYAPENATPAQILAVAPIQSDEAVIGTGLKKVLKQIAVKIIRWK